ncbi:hypothetical protein E0F26_09500 [Candidatus Paraluminiphilus aquimaris]|uniref:DUF3592 domain-containing protein n=1 Tax=Candidatus Paraluminiphilus aquimaris TaxID=2518994 RepID=A0ABY6Q8M3_9GAMM|nr:hypothetical protein [Candidatus Paraluminiphilus aquimaris]UZP74954.1 hypothetical protein E0F26_09500 [Candidatus Paraluminiphilus aquimaris]
MNERLSNLISLGGFLCLLVILATVPFIVVEAIKEHPEKVVRIPCNLIGYKGYQRDTELIGELGVELNFKKCEGYGGYVNIWRFKGDITIAYSDSYGGYSRRDFAEMNSDYSYVNLRAFESQFLIFGGSWIAAFILNYLLVGQARLLPWRRVKAIEEDSVS